MTKYEEMSNAAKEARIAFAQYRERSLKNLWAIVSGLQTICGVPAEKLVYLKWNREYGELRFFEPPESGMIYTLAGATDHDELDDFWYLGLQLWVSRLEWVVFSIAVSERDGKTLFKLGSGKPETVDLSDEKQRVAACGSIADDVISVYREGRRGETEKKFGFQVSPPPAEE
jgi:hypothetical protein